jgi:RNA polymerase sigma-70 factor (ECF subfamily)
MVARVIPIRPNPPLRPESEVEGLFRMWAPYVAGVAIRLLGRDVDVDDVVQDVFVEAMHGFSRVRDASRIKGWLAAITVRLVMRRLRRRRVALALGLGEEWEPSWLVAPEASPEQKAILAQVYRVLETFSTDDRVAWSLRYLQGERLEDVAALCHCSLATAKRRIARVQSVMEEAFRE